LLALPCYLPAQTLDEKIRTRAKIWNCQSQMMYTLCFHRTPLLPWRRSFAHMIVVRSWSN